MWFDTSRIYNRNLQYRVTELPSSCYFCAPHSAQGSLIIQTPTNVLLSRYITSLRLSRRRCTCSFVRCERNLARVSLCMAQIGAPFNDRARSFYYLALHVALDIDLIERYFRHVCLGVSETIRRHEHRQVPMLEIHERNDIHIIRGESWKFARTSNPCIVFLEGSRSWRISRRVLRKSNRNEKARYWKCLRYGG